MKLLTTVVLLGLVFSQPIYAQTANRYDILIDELFPDPDPPIELPNAEFIELKNVSNTAFNLLNWQLSDGTSTATIKTSYVLKPDSFVIICPTSAATAYSKFGATIGVASFPSLNNDGDEITLRSPQGLLIHAVSYNMGWYHNNIKSSGGWTLEMIDTHNPCAGISNWKVSEDKKGGTPGSINSIDGINKDEEAPNLIRSYSIDNTTIVAVFDEPLDSANASQIDNYSFDNNLGKPISAKPVPPLFNEVILKLPQVLEQNKVYLLTTNNISDCMGNVSKPNNAKAGLPSSPEINDMIVNEILFNPPTNGFDYVEFYNRSNKILDMKQLFVATRGVTGDLKSIYPMSSSAKLFFPNEYYVITTNKTWVEQNYEVKYPDKIIELSTLPSLPDNEGTIVLLNENQTVIDELHYNHQWHFALISGEDGIALERIDFNRPTQTKDNWTSAASTAGYGTPTYQNSQYKSGSTDNGEITVSPKIFSPDNDGFEDFCLVNYHVPNPGYVANINIYDAGGRAVRNLANNATLALEGSFKWDGLNNKQQRLPVGLYIILTELFDLNGKTMQFKNVVTIARRL